MIIMLPGSVKFHWVESWSGVRPITLTGQINEMKKILIHLTQYLCSVFVGNVLQFATRNKPSKWKCLDCGHVLYAQPVKWCEYDFFASYKSDPKPRNFAQATECDKCGALKPSPEEAKLVEERDEADCEILPTKKTSEGSLHPFLQNLVYCRPRMKSQKLWMDSCGCRCASHAMSYQSYLSIPFGSRTSLGRPSPGLYVEPLGGGLAELPKATRWGRGTRIRWSIALTSLLWEFMRYIAMTCWFL